VIGQSGSALAGWAFDKEPEKHAKEIAARFFYKYNWIIK